MNSGSNVSSTLHVKMPQVSPKQQGRLGKARTLVSQLKMSGYGPHVPASAFEGTCAAQLGCLGSVALAVLVLIALTALPASISLGNWLFSKSRGFSFPPMNLCVSGGAAARAALQIPGSAGCGPAFTGRSHPCAERAGKEPEPSPAPCDGFSLSRL